MNIVQQMDMTDKVVDDLVKLLRSYDYKNLSEEEKSTIRVAFKWFGDYISSVGEMKIIFERKMEYMKEEEQSFTHYNEIMK